jgi:DNA polymerase III sliding clamp (beta) subunit (PCNA family)
MQTQPNPQSTRASANIPDDTLAELEHQLQVIDKNIGVRVSPQTLTLEELRGQKKNIEELIATRRAELKRG